MILYKYLKKEHLDAFFTSGAIKIGSLYEYRNVETYGGVIGDDSEGIYHTEISKEGGLEVDLGKQSYEADFIRQHIFNGVKKNVKFVMEDGAKLKLRTNSPDLYIYCVSNEYNPVVMKEFGCDSCIEIHRPDVFFKAISKKIRHKAKFEGAVDIIYDNKSTHFMRPHQVHPAVKKGIEYSYQSEVRAIWIPKKEIKSPLFIDVPKAIRACRVFTT